MGSLQSANTRRGGSPVLLPLPPSERKPRETAVRSRRSTWWHAGGCRWQGPSCRSAQGEKVLPLVIKYRHHQQDQPWSLIALSPIPAPDQTSELVFADVQHKNSEVSGVTMAPTTPVPLGNNPQWKQSLQGVWSGGAHQGERLYPANNAKVRPPLWKKVLYGSQFLQTSATCSIQTQ